MSQHTANNLVNNHDLAVVINAQTRTWASVRLPSKSMAFTK
ncbi:hypothetical protein A1OE_1065 [Candidatus Endolissoclinum faulkneri L2]|uniref:Uncharacterized protein n=1 Tax=Candidatus Endolissoclinum faulkneri L2 TaxID=1193729 RepID=K7Z5B7_9PROT|nr:hypothetical protein [Candidatus Endolissoclinum faulkneri]AFX99243.1 hypothetical protein A1OE_1065 [Candidatus Endolissoclinum faulkneri L2]